MKTNLRELFIIFILVLSTTGCQTTTQKEDSLLFRDTFSETSTLSSNWEIYDAKNSAAGPSVWVVEDGKLLQKSNIYRAGDDEYNFFEGTHIVTKKGADWKDYSFSVDFSIAGDNDGVGILFRYQDPEHFYRFITVEDPSNEGPFRKLQIKDGDKYITIAESDDGYDFSKPHKIEVRVVGYSITIFFDGQQILSAKNSLYTSGRIGLMSYAEQPVFDNVLVMAFEISK